MLFNSKKERACLIIEVQIRNYKILNFYIHRAKIISVARLTYNQVDKIYFNKIKEHENFKLIQNLFKGYKTLERISASRNKINFSRNEFQIIQEVNEDFFLKEKKILHHTNLLKSLWF